MQCYAEVGHMGEVRNASRLPARKCEEKKPLEKHGNRWENKKNGARAWARFVFKTLQ